MKPSRSPGRFALLAPCARIALLAVLSLAGACASDKPRLVVAGENNAKLARSATKKEQWLEAAGRWNELYLAGGRDAHEACRETARALWKLGQTDDAKAMLDDGLKRWPDDPELLSLQGDLLASLGFRRAAELSYARSLEMHADQPDTWLALARVRLELGLEEAARSACRKRLELAGACRPTYVVLAEASAAAGDYTCAYESWTKAFELSPGSVDELVAAGSMYQDARGRAKIAGAAASSRVWLLQATELDPQHTGAHFVLGVIAEDAGEIDAAMQHYRRAAETDPAHLPSLLRLIELHGRRGELSAAETIAAAARKTFEKDRERLAAIKQTLERAQEAAKAPDARADEPRSGDVR
ncbi:MAG: tetratricopeptide repeat protein [Planctomycetes bacterium]|nr:tetratricopeptide repeat protein [Planctomycetota bacterium]